MNALSCPVTRAENAYAAQIERKESLEDTALVLLENEFQNAMRAADLRAAMISTPGFNKLATPVVDVFSDLFAARDGDEVLLELLTIARDAAAGRDVMGRTAAWIKARAEAHATWHAADLANDWAEA
jgi:hypothetical protein